MVGCGKLDYNQLRADRRLRVGPVQGREDAVPRAAAATRSRSWPRRASPWPPTRSGQTGLATTNQLLEPLREVRRGRPEVPTPSSKSERTLADQRPSTRRPRWAMPTRPRPAEGAPVSIGVSRELPWSLAPRCGTSARFGRDIWKASTTTRSDPAGVPRRFQPGAQQRVPLVCRPGLVQPPLQPASPASQPLTVIAASAAASSPTRTVRTNMQRERGGLARGL